MSKNNVVKLAGRATITDPLTELLRTGAEQLIYQALEAELPVNGFQLPMPFHDAFQVK